MKWVHPPQFLPKQFSILWDRLNLPGASTRETCYGGWVAFIAVVFAMASTLCHAQSNLALHATVSASSVLEPRYRPGNAVDGVVSDDSRWVSRRDDTAKWIELDLGGPRTLRAAHIYSGWQESDAMPDFQIQSWQENRWQTAAVISNNSQQALAVAFPRTIVTSKVRLVPVGASAARLRELALFSAPVPLGTGVKLATAEVIAAIPTNQHLVALNQVGFETVRPKRFTAPLSPDGTPFEVRRAGEGESLFRGTIRRHLGDFTEFRPADSQEEYVIVIPGEGLAAGRSDPFLIRGNLYQEQFWQPAVDFMMDCRSVVGTHPSAYGGGPWRDSTYYSFEVPSLILFYLSDPARIRAMPVQMDWARDKARVLSPQFKFDAKNPHPEGVMEAVRRYYTELEPPKTGAPDVVQLVHWGLGYFLFHPETRDPSGDPLPKKIHSQTVEQFAFLLDAWPQLKDSLPQSFYDRCRDFAFQHWQSSGLLDVDPLWDAKTYLTPDNMEGQNPTGGSLHPYKGRHAPGHSILPNLLLFEVAKREKRPDAAVYLQAARQQAEWIIAHVDWNDPRTTKGQRMSEFKTMTSLAWFLERYPDQAPAGLKQKIVDWARVAIERSENMWDFRRYDLAEHWTIPKLNETGNLVAFSASALAAARVIDDPILKRRLNELAVAQTDNVFGRNPRLAAAPEHPEKGFPKIERGWPKTFPDNVCARLETTRGALCSSPGTEMYPFNPTGKYRHLEGWVNYNAAWNVALAYYQWSRPLKTKD